MAKKNIKRKTKFAELLKKKGVTAYRLTKMLGYKGGNTVYKWVYGYGEPNAKTMLTLMEILDISALEILRTFAEDENAIRGE